jgi:hypothetical protein
MTCRRSDLQEAFFVPGTHPFRVWGYGTADPLEQVLAPDYFAPAAGQLRPGELIYVSAAAGPGDGPDRGEVRREARLALVMVQSAGRAPASVRLVQDFGRPTDPAGMAGPAAPPIPVKRGRGRPPGSRTRKPDPRP